MEIITADGTSISTADISLPTAKACHSAILMSNGKVLLVGGDSGTMGPLMTNPGGAVIQSNCYVYDPVADTITATGKMITGRGWISSLIPFQNYYYMAIGGYGSAGDLSSVELYDIRTNTWVSQYNVYIPPVPLPPDPYPYRGLSYAPYYRSASIRPFDDSQKQPRRIKIGQ